MSVTTVLDTVGFTLAISGDAAGAASDSLILGEVTDGGTTYLAHNLLEIDVVGDYVDSMDMDPDAGESVRVAVGSAYTVTVSLGDEDDSLELGNFGDGPWSFTQAITYVGGAGIDAMSGPDTVTANTWTLTGDSAGTINATGVVFSEVEILAATGLDETLQGRDVAATWDLNDAPSYTVGAGSISFTGFQTMQGGSDVDTFSVTGSVLGDFSATLNGGDGDDIYVFNNFARLSGGINGEAGVDTLDYASYGSPIDITVAADDADGYTGASDLTLVGAFTGIDAVLASGNTGDQMFGANSISTWLFDGSSSYEINGAASALSLSGFELYQGGSAVDTFNISVDPAADLKGGDGADVFVLSDAVELTNSIDGEANSDNLDLSAYTTALSVTLASSSSAGYSGVYQSTSAFSGIDSVTGGSASDTLTGEDATATWALGASTTYNDGTATLAFSSFQTLQGGSEADTFNITDANSADLYGNGGADVFNISDGGSVSGVLAGGADSDTLSYSSYTGVVAVALTSSAADGFTGTATSTSGFSEIDAVTGGAGSTDTLTGENVASTWTLAATQSYSDGARSLDIVAFETLQGSSASDAFNVTADNAATLMGGSGADSFNFSDGANLTGAIDGEAGSDSLSMSAYTTSVSVTLTGSNANGYSGTDGGVTSGFSGINSVTGGSAADTLTGENVAATWSLGATQTYNDGSGALAFASFLTLQGGSAIDTFNITAANSADLYGNGGADVFNISDGGSVTGVLAGGIGSDTLSYSIYTGVVNVALTSSAADGFTGTATGTSGFSDMDAITGGLGSTDTLTGEDVASTWTLAATQSYSDGARSLNIVAFETLQGGSAIDTFNVTAANSANLAGGGDNDLFTIGAALAGNLAGNDGDDVFTIGAALTGNASGDSGGDVFNIGAAVTGSVTGGIGDDTFNVSAAAAVSGGIAGGDDNDAFNINAAFSGILSGDADNDLFALAAALTGNAEGGDGLDVFNISAAVTGSVTGGSGNDTFSVTAAAAASGGLAGGDDNDTFTFAAAFTGNASGDAGADVFNISAAVTGELTGGVGNDTFNVTSAAAVSGGLAGGDDNDIFNISAALTGTVAGGAGSDTLNLSGFSTARTVTLASSDATGFTGADSVSSGFTGIDNITGGSGSDTLIGENVASTWSLGASRVYNDGSTSLTIVSFETLQGGSAIDAYSVTANTTAILKGGAGADTFAISNGVTLTGSIAGEADSDTLNLSAFTNAVSVALTSSSVIGFTGTTTGASAGFSGIDAITGGSGAADTLTGEDVASIWTLGSTKSYFDGSRSLDIVAFETLQGGLDRDTFDINVNTTATLRGGQDNDSFNFNANGVVLTGKIFGESGTDTIDYTDYTNAVTVNLASSAATGTSGFSMIEQVVGGTATDTIVGYTTANTWDVTAANAGVVTKSGGSMAFTSFGNLTGGAATDTFDFSDGFGVSGTVSGGSGNDTLTLGSLATAGTFSITANNGGNVVVGAVTLNFTAMENLQGGAGNDSFVFSNTRTLSGFIDGQGGADTLNYAAYTSGVRVSLVEQAATGVKAGNAGGIVNLENVIGGAGGDILIGDGGANVLTGNGGNDVLSGNGGDDILLGGNGADILIGGNGADTLDGGAGEDLIVGGRTSYDNNIAALTSLMAEWGRTDAAYATRVARMSGNLAGGRNGAYTLTSSSVFDDAGAADTLTGGIDSLDWFFASAGDTITDLNSGGAEVQTVI